MVQWVDNKFDESTIHHFFSYWQRVYNFHLFLGKVLFQLETVKNYVIRIVWYGRKILQSMCIIYSRINGEKERKKGGMEIFPSCLQAGKKINYLVWMPHWYEFYIWWFEYVVGPMTMEDITGEITIVRRVTRNNF